MKTVTGGPLPKWRDLPDLGLYMDQVLYLVGRAQPALPDEAPALTAAMVHNYVKHGLMPPPVKKKYTREHLACLMIICLLKPILPLNGIRALISSELSRMPMEGLYNAFCAEWERAAAASEERLAGSSTPEEGISPVFSAALLSAAQRQTALSLMPPLGPGEP